MRKDYIEGYTQEFDADDYTMKVELNPQSEQDARARCKECKECIGPRIREPKNRLKRTDDHVQLSNSYISSSNILINHMCFSL